MDEQKSYIITINNKNHCELLFMQSYNDYDYITKI